MPSALAKAIAVEAHRAGKPVFAHVSNLEGIEVALRSGVDILAHTTPITGPWTTSLVERLKSAHMALTPTLTLWQVEMKGDSPWKFEQGMNETAMPRLRAYSEAGRQIFFGTDVGYIQQFDTSEEFLWMSRAGMSFDQILASLTTSPAERFGYSNHSGRFAKATPISSSCAPTQNKTQRHFPGCVTRSEAGASSIRRSESPKPTEMVVFLSFSGSCQPVTIPWPITSGIGDHPAIGSGAAQATTLNLALPVGA